jgi:hypothetical protein
MVPAGIVDGMVRTIVCPETVTAVGVTAVLPTKTVYLSAVAEVELNGSFRVSVTCVPENATVATVGGVTSGWLVELLVTAVFESDVASFPDKS